MATKAHHQQQENTIISIKQRAPVKSIRIERDYSLGDGITRFQTEYPIELTGKVKKKKISCTSSSTNIAVCLTQLHRYHQKSFHLQ
jgi:hypothetical protein